MAWLEDVSVIVLLMLAVQLLLSWANRRYPSNPEPLVEALDALLPQTQCAQCGYPGCRPYAQALAAGETTPDLCPPGGDATRIALTDVLGTETDAGSQLTPPSTLLAWIDETRCVGCALCLPACPVDAIIGANGYTHTVLRAECTGCELCLEPCPVDCIDMLRP